MKCSTCQRPTYAGCGNHVEQVLGDVPPEARCQCATADGPSRGRRAFSFLRSNRRG